MTGEEIRRRIVVSRERLEEVLRGVSETKMADRPGGEWSISDQLAHLMAWQQVALARVEGRHMQEHETLGLSREEYEALDEDGENEVIHTLYANRTPADVLAMLEDVHNALLRALRTVPDERLNEQWLPGRPDRGTLADTVAGNSYDHVEEHLPAIRRLVETV